MGRFGTSNSSPGHASLQTTQRYVERRTPYLSIGETTYGKPILDRTLSFDSSMATALKVAYLSFDSTRFSSTDVGFPIDLVTYVTADRRWRESLYDHDDLRTQSDWWRAALGRPGVQHHGGAVAPRARRFVAMR